MLSKNELEKFISSKEPDFQFENKKWFEVLKDLMRFDFIIIHSTMINEETVFVLDHSEYGGFSLVNNTLIKYKGTHEDRLDFLNSHVEIEHILLDIKDKYSVNELELLDDEESFEMAYLYDYFFYTR